MNSILRRRHRVLVTGLVIVLPLGFLAGLAARMPPAVMRDLSRLVPGVSGEDAPVLAEKEIAVEGVRMNLHLFRPGGPDAHLAVRLEPLPGETLAVPDVLVYWSPESVGDAGQLAERCYLLGALAGGQARSYGLPDGAGRGGGALIFYSLAHQALLEADAGLPLLGEAP